MLSYNKYAKEYSSKVTGLIFLLLFISGSDTTAQELSAQLILQNGSSKIDSTSDQSAGKETIIESSSIQALQSNLPRIAAEYSLVASYATSAWSPPSPDPSGIAYIPSSGHILVCDGEIDEPTWDPPLWGGANVWERTLTDDPVGIFNTLAFSDEPTGVAYNPANQHIYFSDDTGTKSVYDLDPGADGAYGTSDDSFTSIKTSDYGSTDAEGVCYDTFEGHIFWVDGVNREVYEADPGPDGKLGGGDDTVTQFDVDALGIQDPEGVEFNTDNGHLYVLGTNDLIVETTRDGVYIQEFDISPLNARKPAGLAYGPTSNNPFTTSLYIVARGIDNDGNPTENDGMLYEISIGGSLPSISIYDVSVQEGDNGTVNADFTVSLSSISMDIVTVNYTTGDGTATSADNDYVNQNGQVTFQPGETSQSISVVVNGDITEEADETFFVNLSNAVNASIGDDQGIGIILDDDGSGPVTVSFQEGVNGINVSRDAEIQFNNPDINYGSETSIGVDGSPDVAALLFWDVASIPIGSIVQSVDITVNITNTSNATYEIYDLKRAWVESEATWNEYASGQNWQVGGADGPEDRGTTAFGAIVGSSTGTIISSLNAAGVAKVQSWVNNQSPNNGFIVQDYINHSNGLSFSSREAASVSERPKLTVTYVSSSEPLISIDDVVVNEGNSGTVNAVFTVRLSAASAQPVTVEYATASSSATAGSDYVSVSGQVSFAPGETSQPVTVVVNGDVEEESDEVFVVDLSNAVNASIADNQGVCTITDDDGSGPATVTVSFQDGVNGYSGTRDSNLMFNTQTSNYGSATTLDIDGRPDQSGLLSWDLAGIPFGSIIESADITLNITDGSGQTYEFYDLLQPWVEDEATWNEYASGQSWQIAGADGSADRGSVVLGDITPKSKGLTTISLNADGIAVLQSWIDNPSTNHGFIISDYTGATNGFSFSSREHSEVLNHPKLTVTYTGSSQAGNNSIYKSNLKETEVTWAELPLTLGLGPNYPNPFNSETHIQYSLPEQGQVRLSVYNIRGQEVRLLVNGIQSEGFKTILWDSRDDFGREVGSGLYFVRLIAGEKSFVRKVSLLK